MIDAIDKTLIPNAQNAELKALLVAARKAGDYTYICTSAAVAFIRATHG